MGRRMLPAVASQGGVPARQVMALVAVAHIALLGFMLGARAFLVGGDEGLHAMLDGVAAWDAQHYLTVAREGYVAEHLIVRTPGLPLLFAAAAAVLRDPLIAGYLVTLLAHVLAGAHLYALLCLDEPEEVARRALWAWLVFPAAFAFVVPLTEAPFLLGVCGAFYWWRRGRLGVAGLFALLAVLTRIPGILLVPALAVEAFSRGKDRPQFRAMATALAAPCAGFAAYLALNHALEGDALRFIAVQREHFVRGAGSPIDGLRDAWRAMGRPRPENITVGVMEIAGAVLAWAAAGYAVVRRRPGHAVYALLSAAAFTFNPFWSSNIRYASVLFPLYPLLARCAATPVLRVALTGLSLATLALLAMQFARGHWAA